MKVRNMKKTIKNIGIAFIGLSSMGQVAFAKEASGDIQVSAVTLAGCVINADDINFGIITVKPNSTVEHSGGNFDVQCSKGIAFKIVSDSGISEQNTNRYIKNINNDEKLRYDLFGVYPDGTKQLMLGTGSYWGGFNISSVQNVGDKFQFGLTATIYTDASIVSEGQYQDNIALDVVY